MKTSVFISLLLMVSALAMGQSVENGESIFNANCKACHSLGGGRLVGPDLAGVMDRRAEDWVKQFIINSTELIANGDEKAVAIFNEYNKIAMPAHPFSDAELNDLVAFLGAYEPVKEEPVAEVAEEVTEETTVEEASAMPLWLKVSFIGTGGMILLLVVMIGFLVKVLKGF